MPAAKVERAEEIQRELVSFIRMTLAPRQNRPTLAVKRDSDSGDLVVFVDRAPMLGPFFTRVALLLGDAVHNLRSALDHLVHDLALQFTGGAICRPDRTQFPIADHADAFARDAARYLAEVAPADRVAIERFQPYHRMDENAAVGVYFHPLAMLRDLSNRDKHRLLTPVLVPSSGMEFDGPLQMEVLGALVLGTADRAFRGESTDVIALTPGAELLRTKAFNDVVNSTPQAAGFALPNVALEDGRDVGLVLDKISRAVIAVIGSV